ncbi:16294_t:CDS:2, partial [Entrophospora sp. SA101]
MCNDRSNSNIPANVDNFFKKKIYVDKERDKNSIVYIDAKKNSFTDLNEFFNKTTDNDKQQADNFNLPEKAVDVYKNNNTVRLFIGLFKAFNEKIGNEVTIKVLKCEFVGKLFENGICNGMIGVITKVIDDDN